MGGDLNPCHRLIHGHDRYAPLHSVLRYRRQRILIPGHQDQCIDAGSEHFSDGGRLLQGPCLMMSHQDQLDASLRSCALHTVANLVTAGIGLVIAQCHAQGKTPVDQRDPHIARKKRASAIDGRTTRHAGYALSQRRRKTVEEPFGWMKTIGSLAKLLHRGKAKASALFIFNAAAYNLVRMRNLLAEPAPS